MRLALIICIGVVLITVYLRYVERTSFFYPQAVIEITPEEAGMEYEDVCFGSQDKTALNGWFVPAPGASYTILFAHGNAGNISHRITKIELFKKLGYNVFIFDYRGYGKSKGRPSEKGFYKDAQGAYDYLIRTKGFKPEQIIGYGESLGAAVMVDLASKNKLGALIIDSVFSSTKDMAKVVYPFLPLPEWFFATRWDSLNKIKSVPNMPKLFMHSREDEIVPFRLGYKVYDAALLPKDFLELNGGHNDTVFNFYDVFKDGVDSFLRELKK